MKVVKVVSRQISIERQIKHIWKVIHFYELKVAKLRNGLQKLYTLRDMRERKKAA